MKKILLLSSLVIVFTAYAAYASNTGENGEKSGTKGDYPMGTVRIEFMKSSVADCLFDCTVNGRTQTVLHNKYHPDNMVVTYHEIDSEVFVVINNFRDLNGNPFKNVHIYSNYGCKNPKQIPGGYQFYMTPYHQQNGVFFGVSN
ncbi:hypothetical protein [Prevotella sp. 10(H)]|uniref:hypothetical protein n=1 Tax=Prevotella sp. 10(H) TaxID=1158294 RepID=UPI0004A73D98|nr:hypothetical protein [Prevotella sp. 10(H)]